MAAGVQGRKGGELATVRKRDGVQSVPRPMHVLPDMDTRLCGSGPTALSDSPKGQGIRVGNELAEGHEGRQGRPDQRTSPKDIRCGGRVWTDNDSGRRQPRGMGSYSTTRRLLVGGRSPSVQI